MMTIQSYATKINKPLVCTILIVLATYSKVFSQSKAPSVIYDSLKKEILLLNGADSIGSILLDKSFKATLNHEKKRKKKTVYYRLAQYSNPTKIAPVPVFLASNEIILHLQGVLHGDTITQFNCIFSERNGVLLMNTEILDVSVNEFSFMVKLFPNKTISIHTVDLNSYYINKSRKHFTEIIIHGKNGLAFILGKKE